MVREITHETYVILYTKSVVFRYSFILRQTVYSAVSKLLRFSKGTVVYEVYDVRENLVPYQRVWVSVVLKV